MPMKIALWSPSHAPPGFGDQRTRWKRRWSRTSPHASTYRQRALLARSGPAAMRNGTDQPGDESGEMEPTRSNGRRPLPRPRNELALGGRTSPTGPGWVIAAQLGPIGRPTPPLPEKFEEEEDGVEVRDTERGVCGIPDQGFRIEGDAESGRRNMSRSLPIANGDRARLGTPAAAANRTRASASPPVTSGPPVAREHAVLHLQLVRRRCRCPDQPRPPHDLRETAAHTAVS